jgi:hypothetical protein
MNIPTFTRQKFVDSDGNLTPPVQQVFDVFFQQAQINISDDGTVIPSRTTSEINYILSPSNQNPKPNGTIILDSDTGELKVKLNNTIKVIQAI